MTVRPAGHGTIAFVVLIFAWSIAPSVFAQDAQYLALLDAYGAGNFQESVAAAAAWPEPRIAAALSALGPRPGLDRARAAAMPAGFPRKQSLKTPDARASSFMSFKVRLRNSRGDVKARPGYFVNPEG